MRQKKEELVAKCGNYNFNYVYFLNQQNILWLQKKP